jgi:hypothetical protein
MIKIIERSYNIVKDINVCLGGGFYSDVIHKNGILSGCYEIKGQRLSTWRYQIEYKRYIKN